MEEVEAYCGNRFLADMLGMPIQEINTNQGGALGAAILGAVGAGHFSNVEEGCQAMIKVTNKVEPNLDKKNNYEKNIRNSKDCMRH